MTQLTPPRILRLPAVTQYVGLSRSSIYRLMEKGLFPQSIRLGLAAIGWDERDISIWLERKKHTQLH
jgi:prophage regulatory protein